MRRASRHTAGFAPPTVGIVTEPRVDPAFDLDERAMLEAFLDWYRATVFQKCEGLPAGQLAERSAP